MKSTRETVEFVRDALLKQGKKSRRGEVRCLYRGPDGTKCAVGHLIPDEKYVVGLEDEVPTPTGTDAITALVKEAGYEIDGLMLRRLQRLHDNCEVEQWPEKFARLLNEIS